MAEWEFMSSHFVMTYPGKRPKTALPLAFTEYGVTMLANILKSQKARQTSIAIVRAFIALKQFAVNYRDISVHLKVLEAKYNKQFKDVFDAIHFLLQKDKQKIDQSQRKKLGSNLVMRHKKSPCQELFLCFAVMSILFYLRSCNIFIH